MCKALISLTAACQGVSGFPASKRGCNLLAWEEEYVRNGPPKKKPMRSPF